MFVTLMYNYVRNFESKHYSFIDLQNMLYQELKNQIHDDVKAKYSRKFSHQVKSM